MGLFAKMKCYGALSGGKTHTKRMLKSVRERISETTSVRSTPVMLGETIVDAKNVRQMISSEVGIYLLSTSRLVF